MRLSARISKTTPCKVGGSRITIAASAGIAAALLPLATVADCRDDRPLSWRLPFRRKASLPRETHHGTIGRDPPFCVMADTADVAGFSARLLESERGGVFVREGGAGPVVLLLHGFPETGLMWRDIAPILARDFRVIVADLPGYGKSECPKVNDPSTMSKREMAATLIAAMRAAAYDRFAIIGHDRGGRVAYRAALDHFTKISHVAVLDVVPTFEVWDRADARLALSFWPFSLLAQPSPLPERLIAGCPEAIVDNAINEWGSLPGTFPEWVRAAYVDALRDPVHLHAICNEYRAAAGLDRENDKADLDEGRRISCPLLALWSRAGGLATWYEDAGGPLDLWQRWAENVQGQAVDGGHFFPEEQPAATAHLISSFLKS